MAHRLTKEFIIFPSDQREAAATAAVEVPRPSGSTLSSHVPFRFKLDRADLLAMGVIVAALVAVFWRVIFTSDMFFYRDVYNFSYPHAKFIHDMLRQGQLPYWDPYLDYGEPVLADPNFLFFYPDTLLLALLPASLAYTWHYLLHFLIAALGAYWLARRFRQSAPAALFAGLAFGLSGPVLSLGNFYNEVACAAWVPWALLLTDRVLERRNRRSWILLSIVFSLQFLAAEPFTLMATFAMCFAYAVWRSLCENSLGQEGHGWTQAIGAEVRSLAGRIDWRLVAGFALAGALALALSAASLLPSLDLLGHAQRGVTGMPYSETSHWSLHPLYLLEFVLPDFYGSGIAGPSLWTLVLSSRNNPYFTSYFVGFVPLLFAWAGWALGRDPRRRFVMWSGLVFLTLTLGAFTPVFALTYLLFPPLALVRFPVKLVILVVLAIALLAGWGLDVLAGLCGGHAPERDRALCRLRWPLRVLVSAAVTIWILSLIAPHLVTRPATWILVHTNNRFIHNESARLTPVQVAEAAKYLTGHIRLQFPALVALGLGALIWINVLGHGGSSRRLRKGSLALISGLGIFQVMLANRDANPLVPKTFYTYVPPVLKQVPESGKPYRFCYIIPTHSPPRSLLNAQGLLNFESIPGAGRYSALAQPAFRDRLLLVHGSLLTRTEITVNNDVDMSAPPYFYDFWLFAESRSNQAETDCLLGRTNVKYLIWPDPKPTVARREVARVFDGSPKPAYLYEDLCFLPRAFPAASAVTSGSSLETLARLSNPDFDPYAQVILAEEPGSKQPRRPLVETRAAMSAVSEPHDPIGEIESLDEHPNSVSLAASLSKPGFVVLLDRYDPNWRATVDGREVRVFRANQLFRAVQVNSGKHYVRFYYRQKGLPAGVIISGLTLVGLLLAARREPIGETDSAGDD